MVWSVLFCVTRLDFLKSHFKGPKYTISKSSFARKSQMWWYGRGNCVGTAGNSGGSWPPAFPIASSMSSIKSFVSLKRSFNEKQIFFFQKFIRKNRSIRKKLSFFSRLFVRFLYYSWFGGAWSWCYLFQSWNELKIYSKVFYKLLIKIFHNLRCDLAKQLTN